jgi:inorganic triphosphatase YgiF
MGAEVELKLVTSRSGLRKVMGLPWLKNLAGANVRRQRLRSVYFDTEDSRLRGNGISLRVRSADGRRLQTIKAASTAALTRAEWEEEIDRDRPRLELARRTALEPLLVDGVSDRIRPVFETDVERVVMELQTRRSDIELAFDSGRVATPDASIDICEIEIELKAGERSDLARLAQRIARSAPLGLGVRAKADWGYALREGRIDAPMSATPVAIARDHSAAEAFVAIGFACLRQIAGNEFAVCGGAGEGIHQMRVGLRRLRAALSLFKDMLHGKEFDRIKRELKWLTEQLGPARDSDVFLAGTIEPYLSRHPDRSEFEALAHDLDRERRAGFALARTAVESARFRRLLLDCALWLLDGDWRRDGDPLRVALRQRAIRSFARDEMERRTRKIVKRARKLERLDARRRHKLRIAVKKLRYGREFFASLKPDRRRGKARRGVDRALKSLQGALGDLNDISVHAARARGIGAVNTASRKAFAVGFLTGREDASAADVLGQALAAGKRLRRAV